MGNPEHNLAEDVPCGEALVRLRGVGERVGSRDRYLEFRCLHGAAEALELRDPGDCVVGHPSGC